MVPGGGNPQSLNRFSYGYNNPIKYRDPSGHDGQPWWVEAAAWVFRGAEQLVTGPSRLANGLSVGVQNIGNPDYAVHPNTVSTFVDVVASGFVPGGAMTPEDAAARIVPGETEQTTKGLSNTGRWFFGTTDAAVDSYAIVAPLTYGGAGVLSKALTGEATQELPVLVIDAQKMPNVAANVEYAQTNGAPSILTRTTDQALISSNRAAACAGFCGPGSPDEYPFASTMEGGAGAFVRGVPLQEQRIQGGVISRFFSDCGVGNGDQFRVVVK